MAELEPTPLPPVQRWPVVLLVLAGFGLMFYVLQPILLPFVLGAVLAYLGDPLVDYLERHHVARPLGVALVFLLFFAVVTLGLIVFIPMMLQQISALIQKVPELYAWFTQVFMPWVQARLSVPIDHLPEIDWTAQLVENWKQLGKMTATTLRSITGSGADLLLLVANLALVPVVAFYLLRDWDRILDRMLDMLPRAWHKPMTEMVGEADEVVGAFLRGQFMVMIALGVLYSLGLWAVGLQLALLLGALAGLASIVPYLGFIVGISASFVAAWAQFGEWSALLWVAVVFGIGQAVESMLLTPILVGDRIGLHPVAVIFALMAGGQLAGFIGVLIALPLAAVIMVFARHAIARYRASDLYGGD
jgi:predicted PurR-regulated permease PerM